MSLFKVLKRQTTDITYQRRVDILLLALDNYQHLF